ncbi:hypothetical protein CHU98_g8873 [Xylaria longipes]|nr:hypothetical protein CHU98_g8873 [Xylaria longipes]
MSSYNNAFHGQGLQQTGGSMHIGGNFTIGKKQYDETLRKLRSTDPRDDKTRIEQQKGGLLYDSYKWILTHKDFKRWCDGEEKQPLWIIGGPGKGKTMLVCGIIDELENLPCNVIYFFCQATDDRLNNAQSVLRGLMFLLLSRQPELLESVRARIDQAGEKLFQDPNGLPALSNIFRDLIEKMERRRQTTYLIVDALDECLEDQHDLLKWIADLSSRIKIYIDYKVAELAISKRLNAEAQEVVQQHLKSNSGNTFLWVALVCQKLGHKDTYSRKVLEMLHTFPPGLNELYKRMADQFLTLEDVEDAELCCQVLAVQALAYRPLSLAEISSLVEPLEDFSLEWLQEVIELCGSFLAVRDDTIYFVHQSAKDYLIEHVSHTIFRQRLLAGHHTIAVQSIRALSRTLRENIYQLPSLGSVEADHLDDAKWIVMEKQDLENGGLVHNFLEKHLLHWLEALSLLRSLWLGIEALTKVLSILQESKEAEGDLGELVYDVVRFSRQQMIGIETAPLQVYGSGAFSPTRSLVRKLLPKKPEWLLMSPTGESDWSPYRQTLEGHRGDIWSMAFSPNGRHLVSGSYDSTDVLTVSLALSPDHRYLVAVTNDSKVQWDIATGQQVSFIGETDDSEMSVMEFSPDSKLLVSTDDDDPLIRVWEMTAARLQSRISGNLDFDKLKVREIILSPDAKLVGIHIYLEIQVLDTATGMWLGTLPVTRPDERAECLSPVRTPPAFSPDGGHIAYVGKDAMIWILDVAARTPLKCLKGFYSRGESIRWESAGLLTDRGFYSTQALLNDTRDSIEYGHDTIPAGALSGIGISLGRDWILKDGECYLWIPPENRGSWDGYYRFSGNAIAFAILVLGRRIVSEAAIPVNLGVWREAPQHHLVEAIPLPLHRLIQQLIQLLQHRKVRRCPQYEVHSPELGNRPVGVRDRRICQHERRQGVDLGPPLDCRTLTLRRALRRSS